MLQQTQVARVLPKYRAFLRRFPTMAALAAAGTADVLREWRGLGYNSRAVRLKRLAQIVMQTHEGSLPRDSAQLGSLPGIGAYTAAALRAFAFDCDELAVDTNVRRILRRVRTKHDSVPANRGHDFNSALMDLGATICTSRKPKCAICPLKRHCAAAFKADANHSRQELKAAIPFQRTDRYARGRIVDALRDLPPGKRVRIATLQKKLARATGRTRPQIRRLVEALAKDGLVSVRRKQVALAGER